MLENKDCLENVSHESLLTKFQQLIVKKETEPTSSASIAIPENVIFDSPIVMMNTQNLNLEQTRIEPSKFVYDRKYQDLSIALQCLYLLHPDLFSRENIEEAVKIVCEYIFC